MRFDYIEPNKDTIVADGKFIWYYDSKLKDANHAPISRTFADFLLRPHIELSGGDVTITDYRRESGAVVITLTQANDPGAGSLTLTLGDKPLRIEQWRVVDGQARTTQVRLSDPQFRVTLDPKLFVWHDPEDK